MHKNEVYILNRWFLGANLAPNCGFGHSVLVVIFLLRNSICRKTHQGNIHHRDAISGYPFTVHDTTPTS